MASDPLRLSDSIPWPPPTREYVSENRSYTFRIDTQDNWRTPFPVGVLSKHSGTSQTILWQGNLPLRMGPRFTLLSPMGHVVLLDDWLNIKPAHAITIINSATGVVTTFAYDQIVQALKRSPSRLAETARFGSWWIAGPPVLDQAGRKAFIPAGGQRLVVDLDRGTLGVEH